MCCCKESLCNAHFVFAPTPNVTDVNLTEAPPEQDKAVHVFVKILYGLPVLAVVVIIVAVSLPRLKSFN